MNIIFPTQSLLYLISKFVNFIIKFDHCRLLCYQSKNLGLSLFSRPSCTYQTAYIHIYKAVFARNIPVNNFELVQLGYVYK